MNSNNAIPINEAKEWTQKWQENYTKQAKAFLIPVEDLFACMEEMGIIVTNDDGTITVNNLQDARLRAYMGVDGSLTNVNERLVIVGTVKDENTYYDIVEEGNPKYNEGLTGSGAYDLTTPCPNECDTSSSLYHK